MVNHLFLQPVKSTRSDSLDDLLSNQTATDRSAVRPMPNGDEDIPLSTISASYEKLRHRVPVANGDANVHPEVVDWGPGNDINCRSTPAMLLEGDANGYHSVELDTATAPSENNTSQRHSAGSQWLETVTETYAYAYDNPVCTSEEC